MKSKKHSLRPIVLFLIGLCVLLVFLSGLSNLHSGQRQEGRQQLENAVRRAAVACYAAEGVYPPDLEYLEKHYGIQVDRERYTVSYEVFASNLMPEVTVLEHTP